MNEQLIDQHEYRGIKIYYYEKCKEVKRHNPLSGHRWIEKIPTGKFYFTIGDGVRVSCLEEFKTIQDAQDKIDFQLKMMEQYPEVYAKIPRKKKYTVTL